MIHFHYQRVNAIHFAEDLPLSRWFASCDVDDDATIQPFFATVATAIATVVGSLNWKAFKLFKYMESARGGGGEWARAG